VILNIDKRVEDNILTVEITCPVRKFLTHKIKFLTTEDVIGILKKEHKIVKTVLEPTHKVGNTERRKTKLSGQWVFEIEKEKKVRTRKAATPKPKTNNSNKIRSRISKLAKEQKED
tara:strand:+ start:1920 stop:2267 length:348 start_codon:yes stop_codon:yes gene_type:complete